LKTKDIHLDRKILAEMASEHPEKFKQLLNSIN